MFALIVNAAIGASWLAGPDPFGRLSRTRRWIAAGGLGIVGAALVWQGYVTARRVVAGTGGPRVEEGWLLAAGAIVGGALVALIVGYAIWRRRRLPLSGQGLLTGGIVVLLLLGLTGERLALTRAQRDIGAARLLGTWAERMAPTPAQEFIASQAGGGRTLSIGEHANRALVAGLDTVDGYQPIYPLRYHELFGAMIAPQLALDPANDRYYNTWGNRAYAFGPELDMEVASLLGVRWLYVAGDVLTDPSLIERFSAAGVTVYENPGAFPRAFIATGVTVAPDRAGGHRGGRRRIGEGTSRPSLRVQRGCPGGLGGAGWRWPAGWQHGSRSVRGRHRDGQHRSARRSGPRRQRPASSCWPTPGHPTGSPRSTASWCRSAPWTVRSAVWPYRQANTW